MIEKSDESGFLLSVFHRSLSSMFCLKIDKNILPICLPNFAKCVKNSLEIVDFRADVYRNFTKSCRISKNYQILADNFENL